MILVFKHVAYIRMILILEQKWPWHSYNVTGNQKTYQYNSTYDQNQREIFSSVCFVGILFGDFSITDEWRLKTYTLHSWPLSIGSSLACHIYCDTGRPVYKWSSARTLDTHTCCRVFSSGAVTTCVYDLDLSRLGFEQVTFCMQSDSSYWLPNKKELH